MSKPLKSIPISSASTTKIPKTYRSKLYGNFSRLTKYYFQSRQFYSQEVINYCLDLIEQESANILDIGCGTGISTRQLAVRKHQLIGIDSSFDMIARASIPNAKNIKLVTAKAENLPVKPRIFDAVTAFGAFHWFSIPKAVVEIKRVLKLGGTLFIVNKTDKSVFLSQYRKIIENIVKIKLPNIKKGYDPVSFLRNNFFSSIKTKDFTTVEKLSINQALSLYQSISLWSLVPHRFKPQITNALKGYLQNQFRSYVLRPITTMVISGINPDKE